MIQIRCGRCGHTVGASDKYAGKKVLCPKCKAGIEVPQTTQAAVAVVVEQPNIIKFRCPHCNQKIGLGSQYAGKTVRCAKCKNTLQVPQAGSLAEPAAEAGKGAEFNPFADISDFSEIQRAEENAPAADNPLRLSPADEPRQQSEFADMAGRGGVPATSAIGGRGGSRGGSSGFGIDNTLLALLASVVFVIIGGMVWGLVAKYAHMELGLLAMGIGFLAGLGIYIFTSSRGVLLGLAAALIAFFGILSGKYFIAKWYYMPELMAEMEKEGAESFIDANEMEVTEEDVKEILSSPEQMFALAARQLADEGQITMEDANNLSVAKLKDVFRQAAEGKIEEPNEARKQRNKEVEAKVNKALGEWDELKKAEVVKTQYPKMMKEFTDIIKESPIMDVIGFAFAYIYAFSLFDLLWFPLAMVTAYKLGNGEKG